uniref:nicotinamide riboside transporter PnuC n=1 Tax=Ningiella ruwaisensis TaxID=2364274 RepID=UPI0010A06A23|nr:nicotinamide riboside transporter PnuC [Ningiella ruwaisensis]
MNEVADIIIQQWQQQSVFELLAVVFSVTYVWLAAEESVWCWPAALISTTLYTFVFFDVSLIFQMLLNLYYMLMAVIGFYHWKINETEDFNALVMPLKLHILFIGAGLIMTYLLASNANRWFAYELLTLDAAITVFSLLTTYLTVKKYLQSWVYWTLINIASIYLFWSAGLYLTVLLMCLYITIAIRGYINWSKDLKISTQVEHG